MAHTPAKWFVEALCQEWSDIGGNLLQDCLSATDQWHNVCQVDDVWCQQRHPRVLAKLKSSHWDCRSNEMKMMALGHQLLTHVRCQFNLQTRCTTPAVTHGHIYELQAIKLFLTPDALEEVSKVKSNCRFWNPRVDVLVVSHNRYGTISNRFVATNAQSFVTDSNRQTTDNKDRIKTLPITAAP